MDPAAPVEYQTLKRLWKEAEARGWALHPAELRVAPGEFLTVEYAKILMNKFDQERDARTPSAVLHNKACMACWKGEVALAPCVCCKSWALCSTCYGKLEGNCFQCLYTDQEMEAKAIQAARVGRGQRAGMASPAAAQHILFSPKPVHEICSMANSLASTPK